MGGLGRIAACKFVVSWSHLLGSWLIQNPVIYCSKKRKYFGLVLEAFFVSEKSRSE